MSIDYQAGADGIATLTWQMSDAPMNVLNAASMAAYADAVQRAIADPAVKGVIVTSGKPEFIAGGDLNMLLAFDDAQAMTRFTEELHALMRGIEKSGKPFVAALNGSALGGGYEVALSCHRRIAADNPKAQIGLPEVGLGLLPGGGGTQRLPRLIGIRPALPFLLEGKKVSPAQALKAGMVDELVAPAELLERARAWLLAARPEDAIQLWDRKGFKLPGGPVQSPAGYETFTAGNALLRAKTFGNYPAPEAIMSCVYNGCQVDIDTALKVEAREFVKLTVGPVSKNMIRTLFFGIGEAGKLAARPKGVPPASYRRVGILGAGMMGAGIAHAFASRGTACVLKDVSLAKAQGGLDVSRKLSDARVAKGRMSAADQAALLARITPTESAADLRGCDLIIEAVFEQRDLKARVTREAEPMLAEGGVFASNTSTLPITGLAEVSARPNKFIGLHFFSPVDRMPLVEIIRGAKTDDETVAHAYDAVVALGKTPIVVNDSRGFFTSRVFGTFVLEGAAMLDEGVPAAVVENAGIQAGMPVGPLAVLDETALSLSVHVLEQTRADLAAEGK
ncbi:MAG TPA: 3-hydroxyacyl-CoA dehydrogenase NAD-binding domain-containing protein, partial [Burkholderiaceae bacterium]|nr:3-hydroxyacyl-CoA dehydrogenase NAD-binding domain-containing protein [Burkholderiaceae bacterium]